VASFLLIDFLPLTSIICLPYIVLGLAFSRIPYVSGIGKKADISYGYTFTTTRYSKRW